MGRNKVHKNSNKAEKHNLYTDESWGNMFDAITDPICILDGEYRIVTLSGLLPICSSCKKIRDDKGYWIQVERYISEHAEVDFSHAICPECIRKMYPKHYKKIEAMKKNEHD